MLRAPHTFIIECDSAGLLGNYIRAEASHSKSLFLSLCYESSCLNLQDNFRYDNESEIWKTGIFRPRFSQRWL